MRKLAAKTLIEILPSEVSTKVQERLDEQGANPDFVTLIGLVSFYGQDQSVRVHNVDIDLTIEEIQRPFDIFVKPIKV